MPKGKRTSGEAMPNKRQKTNDAEAVQQSEEIAMVTKAAPEDDWQVNKPLAACLGVLQEKSHLSDVIFEFPKEAPVVRLEAHKLILAARSPVFEAMFYGPLGRQDKGPVQIVDSTSQAFKEMLRFLYTDTMSALNLLRELLEVLGLSHKYRIESLTNWCCSYLEDKFARGKMFCAAVLNILRAAMLFDLSVLKQRCLMCIDTNGALMLSVLMKTSWLFIPNQNNILFEIIRRDTFLIDECKIYLICKFWAKKECARHGLIASGENMRRVLDRVFYQIRFPLLQAKFLSDQVAPDGMLTEKELLNLFIRATGTNKTADTGTNKIADTDTNKTADTGTNKTADTGTSKTADTGPNKTADTGTNKIADTGSNKAVDIGTAKTADMSTNKTSDMGMNKTADTGTKKKKVPTATLR